MATCVFALWPHVVLDSVSQHDTWINVFYQNPGLTKTLWVNPTNRNTTEANCFRNMLKRIWLCGGSGGGGGGGDNCVNRVNSKVRHWKKILSQGYPLHRESVAKCNIWYVILWILKRFVIWILHLSIRRGCVRVVKYLASQPCSRGFNRTELHLGELFCTIYLQLIRSLREDFVDG